MKLIVLLGLIAVLGACGFNEPDAQLDDGEPNDRTKERLDDQPDLDTHPRPVTP